MRDVAAQALPVTTGSFPVATLIANLTGACLLGAILGVLSRAGADVGWRRRARLVAGPGFCGGYTTYSTFALETVQLARHDRWLVAVAYLTATVIGGLAAAAFGLRAAGGVVR